MKFSFKITSFGRSGCISELSKPWNKETFKTPFMLTYTKAGTIPHLTYDSIKRLHDQEMILLQTLPSLVEFKEAVSGQGKGLNTFVGLPEFPFFVSVQDPGTSTPTGYNVNKGVSVWCEGGRRLLTPSDFMTTMKAFRPAIYQALTDGDTPQDCSKKRLNKSVDNSLKFLDQCLEEHSASTELENTAVFASIQGGNDSFLRKKSAQETAKREVDGFVIDGINFESETSINFENLKNILQEIYPLIPENKPRMLPGAHEPDTILEAVKAGIDIFDSSYAYKLTEAGSATVYDLRRVKCFFQYEALDPVVKKTKQTNVLCLKEDIYKEDFSPILENCNCYTCTHYTRAYVNHLLLTSELLSYILLMIHNLHHLSLFFKEIRNALESKL